MAGLMPMPIVALWVALFGFYALSAIYLAFGVDHDGLSPQRAEPTRCQMPASERHSWVVMWVASSLALYPLTNLERWYWSSLEFFSFLEDLVEEISHSWPFLDRNKPFLASGETEGDRRDLEGVCPELDLRLTSGGVTAEWCD